MCGDEPSSCPEFGHQRAGASSCLRSKKTSSRAPAFPLGSRGWLGSPTSAPVTPRDHGSGGAPCCWSAPASGWAQGPPERRAGQRCGGPGRCLSVSLAPAGTDMAVFCLLCGKRFQTQSALQQHMEVHAGVRSYICSECNRTFPSHTALKRHLRSHTGTMLGAGGSRAGPFPLRKNRKRGAVLLAVSGRLQSRLFGSGKRKKKPRVIS